MSHWNDRNGSVSLRSPNTVEKLDCTACEDPSNPRGSSPGSYKKSLVRYEKDFQSSECYVPETKDQAGHFPEASGEEGAKVADLGRAVPCMLQLLEAVTCQVACSQPDALTLAPFTFLSLLHEPQSNLSLNLSPKYS